MWRAAASARRGNSLMTHAKVLENLGWRQKVKTSEQDRKTESDSRDGRHRHHARAKLGSTDRGSRRDPAGRRAGHRGDDDHARRAGGDRGGAGAYGDEVLFGAGTVLDAETARAAILAGAGFIVAPTLNLEVIELCNRYSIPVMPGCYTPTEMLTAWEAGADMIKLFPADVGGPGVDQGDPGAAAAVADRAGGRRRSEHRGGLHPERGSGAGRGQQPDQPEAARPGDMAELTRRAAAFIAEVKKGRGK